MCARMYVCTRKHTYEFKHIHPFPSICKSPHPHIYPHFHKNSSTCIYPYIFIKTYISQHNHRIKLGVLQGKKRRKARVLKIAELSVGLRGGIMWSEAMKENIGYPFHNWHSVSPCGRGTRRWPYRTTLCLWGWVNMPQPEWSWPSAPP